MSSMFNSDHSPIYSTVAGDPCLGPIVDSFVSSIPQRVADLESLADRQDWSGLQSLAHQIKGAATSYGFAEMTFAAAFLEQAARTRNDIDVSFNAMVELCQRIRSRPPLNSQKDN